MNYPDPKHYSSEYREVKQKSGNGCVIFSIFAFIVIIALFTLI